MTPRISRPMLAFTLCFAALSAFPTHPVIAQDVDPDAGAYLAARSALAANSYAEAAGWFGRALVADRDNGFLLDGLLLSSIGTGDFATAIGAAEALFASGGRSIAASIALLVRDVKAGDFEALLQAPPERNIGNLMDRLVTAWSEFGIGSMTEALARFDEIAATEGLKPFGLYHKALALAAVGDFEAADAILAGREAGPLVVNRRGVIAHAQILSQLERPGDALGLLERSFGNEPEPLLDALRADLAAGKPVPFDAVKSAQDGVAEVLFTLAVALNGEANDAYTLLYARAAMELNPAHTEATLLTAGLLEQLGQIELASAVYGAVPPGNPAYYSAEIGRISTLFALDRKDEGFAALESLGSRYPEIGLVHSTLGDALRRNERFAEAAEAYGRAIALIETPTQRHWPLFYSRGVAYERAGDWPKAEADFRKALELNPDQPQVLNYLGYSFVDRGENLDEALDLIERAVAAQPEAGYIIDSLAWAYFRLGRYEDALEPMERASLLEPVDPVVTDHLGDVYWAVGREMEARFQWRRALSFEPEEDAADRIRRKLEVGLDAVLEEEGAPPRVSAPNAD